MRRFILIEMHIPFRARNARPAEGFRENHSPWRILKAEP